MILDQISDQNRAGLYQISQCTEVPDFVKEAGFSQTDLIQNLPPTSFADPDRRKYPVHSAPDTWMSCAYFAKFAGSEYDPVTLAQVNKNLDDACSFWRVMRPKIKVFQKSAASVRKVVYRMGTQVHAETEVADGAGLQKLAEDLVSQRANYPYPMRQDAARQILKHAAELKHPFGYELNQDLQKLAAYAVGSYDRLLHAMRVRKAFAPTAECSEALAQVEKMAADVQNSGLLPPVFTEKVARFADWVDRFSGMHRHYGIDHQPPEDMFRYTMQDGELLHKSAVRLSDGTLISEKEAQAPAVLTLLSNLNGREVSAGEAIPALHKLSREESRLVQRALAS